MPGAFMEGYLASQESLRRQDAEQRNQKLMDLTIAEHTVGLQEHMEEYALKKEKLGALRKVQQENPGEKLDAAARLDRDAAAIAPFDPETSAKWTEEAARIRRDRSKDALEGNKLQQEMFDELSSGLDAVKTQEDLDRLWSYSEERGIKMPTGIGRTLDPKTKQALDGYKTMSKGYHQQAMEQDRKQQIADTQRRMDESERKNREDEARRDREDRARQERYDTDEKRHERDEDRKDRDQERKDRELADKEAKRKEKLRKPLDKFQTSKLKDEILSSAQDRYPNKSAWTNLWSGEKGAQSLSDNELTRMADDVHSKMQEKMLADDTLSQEEARDAAMEEVVGGLQNADGTVSYKRGGESGASNAAITPTSMPKPTTREEVEKLAPGTKFIWTDGKEHTRQ